uniref:39S ribosomal protein L41, mitochondrial n=1 Tax=Rhizochromulina marina TaxID=1034831 RepID=A0A7S2RFS1_9STRA
MTALSLQAMWVAAVGAARAAVPCLPTQPLRLFSKYYGNALRKRLPLSPKRARKGYYKGNGCRSEGRHTSKGGFVVDKNRLLELVVPDLQGFKLKPYVSRATEKSSFPVARALFAEGPKQP